MNNKPLQFSASAGEAFMLVVVSVLASFVPILGHAFALNYANKWVAERTMYNGKKATFNATYGEALKFVVINGLLLIITLGVYIFWFIPKQYAYFADHVEYAENSAAPLEQNSPTPPQPPAQPAQ